MGKITRNSYQKVKKRLIALKNLPLFFADVWETHSSRVLVILTFRIVRAFIPLAMIFVSKLIIDQLIGILNGNLGDKNHLWLLVGIEFGLAILFETLNRFLLYNEKILGEELSIKTSLELMKHAVTLDLANFENDVLYDKIELARRQVESRATLLTQVFAQIQDIITLFFLGIGLFIFSPILLIILIFAVIPTFIVEIYFNEISHSLNRNWTPQRRKEDYFRNLLLTVFPAKEIKIFGLSNHLMKLFKDSADKRVAENRSVERNRFIYGSLISIVSYLFYYGSYIFILNNALLGTISIGTMIFLSTAFQRIYSTVQTAANRMVLIGDSALNLQDYYEFFEIKPKIPNNPNGQKVADKITSGITFENVGFKYPNSENWALRNVSFNILPQETLAIVGENGSGKTTLVKLITRLYEPTEGRILFNGVDLKDYDLADLRSQMSVIFQDFIRYQVTAAENIGFGDVKNLENTALIRASAVKAQAADLIENFPDKYNQMLGLQFKGGLGLSGGEWQKIAIARAYLRDAKIIILDEPTAALDVRSEYEVFKKFSEVIENKLSIIISHRLASVQMANHIMFLQNGEIAEFGTHDELLEKKGNYFELFSLQSKLK